MPTYEYKCDACGYAFERFQSITAAPVKKCPECGKNKVKRLIGVGAGLLFKGSGFYITDYRSEAYKSAAKSDSATSSSGDAAKSDSGASSKSDSKPAAAAAAASTSAPKSESKSASKSKK